MRGFVIGTPSSDGITNVAATKFDLGIVTHGYFWEKEESLPERVRARLNREIFEVEKVYRGAAGAVLYQREGDVGVVERKSEMWQKN